MPLGILCGLWQAKFLSATINQLAVALPAEECAVRTSELIYWCTPATWVGFMWPTEKTWDSRESIEGKSLGEGIERHAGAICRICRCDELSLRSFIHRCDVFFRRCDHFENRRCDHFSSLVLPVTSDYHFDAPMAVTTAPLSGSAPCLVHFGDVNWGLEERRTEEVA